MVFENDDLFPENPEQCIKGYLDLLINKFGDFKVHSFYQKNGETIINPTPSGNFKRMSCLDLQHQPQNALWNYYFQAINQRTIFPCEIVLDCESQEVVQEVMKKLESQNTSFLVFSTKSKGAHIHIYFPELTDFPLKKRELFRENYCILRNADILKKSENSLIALEYARHWKSGQPKKLVYAQGNGFNYFNFSKKG